MSDFLAWERPDPELLREAVLDQRWTAIARADADLGTIATWDPTLSRRHRILVPVDVQAFVVPTAGGEPTVPMTGSDGDPAPFSAGAVRTTGIHLHWAMPDALLRGEESADGTELTLPPLPDRWVVVRSLLPEGARRAIVTGWVIESKTAVVSPLDGFTGTPAAPPADRLVIDPLDGGFGGSLTWTASYEASAQRFAVHDPLADLPALQQVAPQGFHRAHAVYTVAGWWTDGDEDPLTGISGRTRLDRRLADLGWLVTHDGIDDDPVDPRLVRMREQIGFDAPDDEPAVEVVLKGRTERFPYVGLSQELALPVDRVSSVFVGPAQPTYSTLLHGAVVGVPIDGSLSPADDRPAATDVGVAVGLDVDDVVGAFGAEALGLSGDQRLASERLVAAFAGDLLDRLGTPDGIPELEEREHSEGFWSFPGPPLPGAKPDRLRAEDSLAVSPTTVGRKGRGALAATYDDLAVKVTWDRTVLGLTKGIGTDTSSRADEKVRPSPNVGESRDIVRPAPRLYRPQPPLVALRGAKPSHRHHDDGLYDETGRLRCRYPSQTVTALDGVVEGDAIVSTLGSGAIPSEVVRVVRESVLLDPYAHSWLAAAGAEPAVFDQVHVRIVGELVRLYGIDGTYDASGAAAFTQPTTGPHAIAPRAPANPWQDVPTRADAVAGHQLASELVRFSLYVGMPPSPMAITTWRQPWVPLWLEWRVVLEGTDTIDGWTIDGIDLERQDGTTGAGSITREYLGRSIINEGIGTALRDGIQRWLDAENQRQATDPSRSQLSPADEDALDRLGDLITPLDLVSASLDGIREELLGIPYVGQIAHADDALPQATGLPVALFGGTMRVAELRLVDAFGRTLDIPVPAVRTTSTLEIAAAPTTVRLRPRFQHAARWLFRLVDPGHAVDADAATAPEAFVDQLRPDLAVNPVAGFLLPDHVDEALELFDVTGSPIGQLGHDSITGGVIWEPAPGRSLPPDAGPRDGLDAHASLLGRIAAGVTQVDVSTRAGAGAASSSLSALLRAIDTTLWTVDTFAAVGSPTVAGLIGRPIAVVRATLRLEAPDDVDELDVVAPGGAEARRAAFAGLADQRFPVRIGDLRRSDDSVLGFFVDDDYLHLHLVDKVVASTALESGRHRGHLGLLGDTPAPDPLQHPYVVAEDTMFVRPGQTLRLTLLMLPAGRAHLTSGVLPRKALALSDDWVTPGLSRLMPSLRVGPVLVDPSEIRLPLVHLLGERQTFTRRTGPLTWRDDPIVAASQAALLPRMPHEVQEGWIRVTPAPPPGGDG